MNEQAIIPVGTNGNGRRSKMAPFGSNAEVIEYAKRLQSSITIKLTGGASRKMTLVEACSLASASLAHGLDPYTGEIYPTVDKNGDFKLITGRDAWTKAARRCIEKEGGGNYWYEKRIILDKDERLALRIPAGAIAYEIRLYDTPSIREYVNAAAALSSSGASWEKIEKILGERPYTSALGIYEPSTQTQYQDAKWNPHERAEKRGLMACLKKRYHLPFDDYGEGTDELSDDYKSKKALAEPVTVEASPVQKSEQRKKDKEALYPTD